MIAGLVILIIIIAMILTQYLNGSVLKAFFMIISAVTAMIVAFSYFEVVANIFITKGLLIQWVSTISLILLFIITFGILQLISRFVIGSAINFSELLDRIICSVCGAVVGVIVGGVLVTALTMTPILAKWTYSRYDTENFDIESPSNALIPADKITAGIFGVISNGSMKSKKSFSSMHPSFINQIHLNNLHWSDGTLNIASSDAIATKANGHYWRPTEELTSSATGEIIEEDIIILRAALKQGSIAKGGAMGEDDKLITTLAQFQLIISENADNKFNANSTKAVYPMGYVKKPGVVGVEKNISNKLNFGKDDVKQIEGFGKAIFIDLVFEMPKNHKPIAFAFRNNAIVELSKEAKGDKIPKAIITIQEEDCAKKLAQVKSVAGVKIKPKTLASNGQEFAGMMLNLNIESLENFGYQSLGDDTEISKQIICGSITFKADAKLIKNTPPTSVNRKGLATILARIPGYSMMSLKCKFAPNVDVIDSSDFPALIDINGKKHFPTGLLLGRKKSNEYFYQLDYCSRLELLDIQDGKVSSSYPKKITGLNNFDEITEAYFIYQVNTPKGSEIIMNVEVSGKEADFEEYDGYLIDTSTSKRK